MRSPACSARHRAAGARPPARAPARSARRPARPRSAARRPARATRTSRRRRGATLAAVNSSVACGDASTRTRSTAQTCPVPASRCRRSPRPAQPDRARGRARRCRGHARSCPQYRAARAIRQGLLRRRSLTPCSGAGEALRTRSQRRSRARVAPLPDRRQLARLPRLLRAPRGARDDGRLPDERAARLREHAHAAAHRLPPRRRDRGLGHAAGPPPRALPRLQGLAQADALAAQAAAAVPAPAGRGVRVPQRRARGLRGRRRDRHAQPARARSRGSRPA